MPYFLSITAVAIIVYSFLSPTNGVLTKLVYNWTGTKVNFYNEPKYWPFLFVLINAWKSVGYSAIVYLASITGISKEYYEAAMLDGATKVQQVRYITLPQLRTIITVLLIMSLGGIFSGDFGLFYSVPFSETNKAVYASGVSKIIDTYIYNAFKVVGDTGLSVAAGFFQSVVGFITMIVANGIVSKVEPDSALF
jgi:putative aldouronate transport system permease protein